MEQYYQFRGLLETALAGSNIQGADPFGCYGRERALRDLLGLSPTDGRLIRPIDEPSIARMELDWNECVVQTLYLSPELRRQKTRIKQSELELVTAKNQILPEVNLSFLYRWVGVGDELGLGRTSDARFPNPGSTALGELTGGDFQELAARLDVTPPAFGARRELTRIRGAQWRLTQAKAFLQEQERLLISQLSGAFGKVAVHYQLMQTNAQRWQAAESEVETRLAEFKAGRSPVDVVLDSQRRRALAQIDYYRALGEYNKSINYVDYLKGTLLASSNITLSEGPWNKKAYWDALERARERSAGTPKKYGVTRPGVVRQGPVQDANSVFGSGVDGALPAGDVILEGPADPMGLNLETYRDAIDVNDTPLSEMGEPQQMFELDPPIEPIAPGAMEPDTGPLPLPNDRSDEAAEPLPSSSVIHIGKPPSGMVSPASYQSNAAIDQSPLPVARKPLPH